jgi:hypothetical protein
MKFSSVFSGLLAAAASTLATHADIVYSGTIDYSVAINSSYTMTITEGDETYSWQIEYRYNYVPLVGETSGTGMYFTPMTASTGVAASLGAPWVAERFGFEQGIGPANFFSIYPTGGTSNEQITLRNTNGQGNFTPGLGAQYAGFSFGGPLGTSFYGWLSLNIGVSSLVVNSFAYNNGPIGAGMFIPAPGAIALLGLVGLVGGRRRA